MDVQFLFEFIKNNFRVSVFIILVQTSTSQLLILSLKKEFLILSVSVYMVSSCLNRSELKKCDPKEGEDKQSFIRNPNIFETVFVYFRKKSQNKI